MRLFVFKIAPVARDKSAVLAYSRAMFILIDNYDSFTYNLVHYLGELGAEVDVIRNDKITPMEVMARRPEGVILSPGPCTPDDAGICLDMVTVAAQTRLPLLGVCLGHQSIGQALGGLVIRETPRHGKLSEIRHRGKGLFKGLPDTLSATRYHSLVVERASLPAHFEVTAETTDALIMGMNHRDLPIHGLQFHPESIETEHGHGMLRNFLDSARAANNQIEWPNAAA